VPTSVAPTWHGRGREGRRGRGRTSLRPLPCRLVARPPPAAALSRRPLLRRLVTVADLRPLPHCLVTVAGAGEGRAGEEEATEGVVVVSANLTRGGAPRWGRRRRVAPDLVPCRLPESPMAVIAINLRRLRARALGSI
jgi:hypothetical protein